MNEENENVEITTPKQNVIPEGYVFPETILEKEFEILDTTLKNQNHRRYTDQVVDAWINDERNESEGGFDIEYAYDEEIDIENEFLVDHLSCGTVKLRKDGSKLIGSVRFKKNENTVKLYTSEIELDKITIVPKGKGSVRNQEVQDDYELYGFNLINIEESSFMPDEELEKKEEKIEE